MKITASDQQLLTVLRENARASTAEIARRLKLSRTTVQSRIEISHFQVARPGGAG